jgi:uncharacterized protein (TIGR02453 family)
MHEYDRAVRPQFTNDTLRFLRALKRNNDREWFKARKDEYERHVRAPMLAVIEQLAVDFKRIAPELVASPKASLYRIYRDTRFSEDKTPLKTHAAAVFPWRGLARHEGAGLYFEVAPSWVWIGGGMYAPQPPQLVRVREHIASTWPEIHRIASRKSFLAVTSLDGERLTRVPRGYAVDHPAADYLKHRQFLAGRELPAAIAADDDFYPTLLTTFKAIVPLVAFLNAPLVNGGGHGGDVIAKGAKLAKTAK